jgi:class 3 adenylate cyclase/tetratricopeptide (TPR) repeat protein
VDAASRVVEERKIVTVLFADVTGSTQLGERLDPEHLRDVMARYFAAMREEIEAEGGVVEKFIGDAVMAAFGVPAAHEDDPSRAVRAAIRMRERLAEVNTQLAATRGVTLEVRIGINTGEVLASVDAAPGEPMVTGDTVNVAARLQGEASPGGVLASERTARAARGFRFRHVGTRDLKGKAAPVPVFALADEEEATWERGVPGLRAPLVGRDAELSLLRSLFARTAAEGTPNLVTIYGDAGVGKSRLTTEFVFDAEVQGAAVLRGRCLPYGDGITYWPLAEILKTHTGVLDPDPPELVLEKIRKAGRELLTEDVTPDPARAIAALAYTVSVDDPEVAFSSMEPRQVRQEVHAAWRSFLSALAARSPVVVVVEDIHWADPALLDLLDECAERVVGPVLFLCPSRPDLSAVRPTWGGGRRNHSSIALDPLTQEQSDHLIRALLTVDDLPLSVHDRILTRAEGNPFFLEEIIRHLIDEGHVERDGDRWRARSEIDRVQIPDTVQAVLAARIDLLDAATKRVLQGAAVVGRIFWPGPVAALAGASPEEVEDALRLLEDREMVVSRLTSSLGNEPEFAFKHVLTRDVAYAGLPLRDRGGSHAVVAGWIEQTAGDRRRDFVELLAYHYEQAFHGVADGATADREVVDELRGKAGRKLLAASEDANRKFAMAKSLRLAERALAIAGDPYQRALALERLGLASIGDYRGDLAWDSLTEAADLVVAEAGHDRRLLARICSRALEPPLRWPGSMRSRPSESRIRRYLELGLESSEGETDESRIRMLIGRAFLPWAISIQRPVTHEERQMARSDGERAAAMALDLGRFDLASAALDGAASATIARYGTTLALQERRLELVDRIEDPWEVGDIYAMMSWFLGYMGDFPRANTYAEEGIAKGAGGFLGTVLHNLSWYAFSLFGQGEWDRILSEIFPTALEQLGERREDPPYFTGHLIAATAFILDARGDPGAVEARSRVERMAAGTSPPIRCWWAWLLLRRSHLATATKILDDLVSDDWSEIRPFSSQVYALALDQAADWASVPGFLSSERSYAAEARLVALPVHLDRLEGRAALAAGEAPRALELLTEASDGFERLGARWERACTDLSLAEVQNALGRTEDARSCVARALETFEGLRSLPEIERARSLL